MSLRHNTHAASPNIPEKGTLPPLAAASGHLIPDSRAERDKSVLRESKKLRPLLVSGKGKSNELAGAGGGVKRTRLGWVAEYKTGT
jgi:hypothetical protein